MTYSRFAGVAKSAAAAREAFENMLSEVVADLATSVFQDLGPVANINLALSEGFDLVVESRKTGRKTFIPLPVSMTLEGSYQIDDAAATREQVESYFLFLLTCGKLLDVLVKIRRGA